MPSNLWNRCRAQRFDERDNEVLSRDESGPDRPLAWKRVEETFVRLGRVLHLHVGGQVIRTTAEHPFWAYNKGWTPAGELVEGDRLSSHNGGRVTVEEVFDSGEYVTVYNLRVADFHTYFVGNRRWNFSIWAHNAGYATKAGGTGADYDEVNGQGIYVLRNPRKNNRIEYVGRGDAPTRLAVHARPGSGNEDLVGEILFNNNLPARQAVSLEQKLQQVLGGVKSTSLRTPLRNSIQALGEQNPNFIQIEFAADDKLVIEALRRAKII